MVKKYPHRFLKFFVILLATIFVFIGMSSLFFKFDKNNSLIPQYPHQIVIDDSVINLHLAISQAEKEIGLAKFSSLPKDEGMLFIFDTSARYSFWMKDMKFPIDIMWISDDLKIVHIEKDVSPDTYPKEFIPKEKALYVFEVNAGFSDTHDIKVGDSIELE